jgi:hypothetical protein
LPQALSATAAVRAIRMRGGRIVFTRHLLHRT